MSSVLGDGRISTGMETGQVKMGIAPHWAFRNFRRHLQPLIRIHAKRRPMESYQVPTEPLKRQSAQH
jgi:hypothetical protein